MPITRNDEDMYSDVSATAAKPEMPSSEEYELPRAILMGQEASVGDELTLKITGIGDDTVSVQYASAPETESPEAEGEEEIAAPQEDEMAAMME